MILRIVVRIQTLGVGTPFPLVQKCLRERRYHTKYLCERRSHVFPLHYTSDAQAFCCDVFGRPFVKQLALCYQTVVCLSVLSVTFVHWGQTVGRIKMKLGMLVGLGPGHIVLDGDPAPPSPKGHSPPIFGPYLLRPNGCMD